MQEFRDCRSPNYYRREWNIHTGLKVAFFKNLTTTGLKNVSRIIEKMLTGLFLSPTNQLSPLKPRSRTCRWLYCVWQHQSAVTSCRWISHKSAAFKSALGVNSDLHLASSSPPPHNIPVAFDTPSKVYAEEYDLNLCLILMASSLQETRESQLLAGEFMAG